MNKAIVIFSGGPDSTAAAQWAIREGYSIELLTFKFTTVSQEAELQAAVEISTDLGLKHTILDFTSPMHVFSPESRVLMHVGVPKSIADKNKPHLLAFGSGMTLSTVACYALYNGIDTIIWGATKDDGFLNKDYRQEFTLAFANLISETTGVKFNILVPFSGKHKYEVLSVYKGNENLFSKTFSCLFPIDNKQCGICKACVTRRVSAKLASFEDRTFYMNKEFNNPLSKEKRENPSILVDEDFEKIITEGMTVPYEAINN